MQQANRVNRIEVPHCKSIIIVQYGTESITVLQNGTKKNAIILIRLHFTNNLNAIIKNTYKQ